KKCRGRDQRLEPDRLIEVRLQPKGERRSGLIPDAILVGSDHAKDVAAGREVRVAGRPARTGVHPVVEAFQLVAETHLVRVAETVCRIPDLEPASAWRNSGRPPQVELLSVGHDLLDDDRGSDFVRLEAARVDGDHSPYRRKP